MSRTCRDRREGEIRKSEFKYAVYFQHIYSKFNLKHFNLVFKYENPTDVG